MHGPTFMANPLACAVALASLELLADGSWRERRGARSSAGCATGSSPRASCPGVADVRVLGAIGVVQLEREVDVAAATAAAVERGVWLRPFRDLIYTMPPYVIGADDLAAVTGADGRRRAGGRLSGDIDARRCHRRPITGPPASSTGSPASAARPSRLLEVRCNYRLDRVALHTSDSYAGIPLSKFPEDLRLYEHILWARRPQVVIEIGIQHGASSLWFRDRLRTLAAYGLLARPWVIGVDVEVGGARANLDSVDARRDGSSSSRATFADPKLAARVAAMVPAGAECFVVEDSAHVYETTLAALEGFSALIAPGGFFIVEDGCVDIEEMRLEEGWPRGVLPAVSDWLDGLSAAGSSRGAISRSLRVTCHPGGLLQRREKAAPPGRRRRGRSETDTPPAACRRLV